MLRKGQKMHGVEKGNISGQISFIAGLFGLVAEAQQVTRLHAHLFPRESLHHSLPVLTALEQALVGHPVFPVF